MHCEILEGLCLDCRLLSTRFYARFSRRKSVSEKKVYLELKTWGNCGLYNYSPAPRRFKNVFQNASPGLHILASIYLPRI